MSIPDIITPDGRRAWAFAAIVGGCMVQTVYLFVVTIWLRGHPEYLFYLALAGDVLLLVGMTALGWALGRRIQLRGGKDGVEISDKDRSDV